MKWLVVFGVLLALLVLAVGVVALVGSRLPKDHVASRRISLHRAPPDVFTVLRDFAGAPAWRSDLKRVTILGEAQGRLRFREDGSNGAIVFELVEEAPPARLVTRIADDTLPFGGAWTYELRPVGNVGGTELTITERGEVRNVVFRALSKYVFTHHRTIDLYLRALGKRFGEDVSPQSAPIG